MTFSEWFKIIFGQIGTFLVPLIKRFLSETGLALAEVATEVVEMLATTDMSGDDKRKEATRLILERLKAKGITASTSFVQDAIQAAVAKLKLKETG